MTGSQRLSDEHRELFALLSRAVFANPFGEERAEIDARIGGCSPEEHPDDLLDRVMREVTRQMNDLEKDGRADVGLYRGEDLEILTYAILFEVYHRYKDDFDLHISEQIEAGDSPRPVEFSRETIDLLTHRGFSPEEAVRYFALFYQLRRAYFFIDRSLVGESSCMKELRRNLWNNVFTSDLHWYDQHLWNRMEDFSTLLLGETGTGKGSAAAAIGRSGFIPFDARRGLFRESFTRTFVSLNLSQFPESLIESELFGHRKGSFTGAVDDHQGIFSTCVPFGSILLDEIGEVSGPVQIKLLQVLQGRIFSPVGSHEKKRFRGRVIGATNRPLERLRDDGMFRDDFFYRLCSDLIVVPPLRQRISEDPEELEILARHTLRRTLGEEAPEVLDLVVTTIRRHLGLDYHWPGNVRELEQCVRRILIKRSYEGDLPRRPPEDLRARLLRHLEAEALDASGVLEGYCALLHERHGSYEQVARITHLDRRTVKKYVARWRERDSGGEGR